MYVYNLIHKTREAGRRLVRASVTFHCREMLEATGIKLITYSVTEVSGNLILIKSIEPFFPSFLKPFFFHIFWLFLFEIVVFRVLGVAYMFHLISHTNSFFFTSNHSFCSNIIFFFHLTFWASI